MAEGWAHQGARATQYAQAVMAEHGLNSESHCSQSTNSALLKQYKFCIFWKSNIGLCTKSTTRLRFESILTICELIGECRGFDDPVGGSVERYCTAQVEIATI